MNTVNLVYFSGTGGTARVASCIEAAFSKRGVKVVKTKLNSGIYAEIDSDLLVILYPVYAFNAPQSVDEWINIAPGGNGKPAVILSISGGGEVSPNSACRMEVKKNLEKKGYHICYESMFVMPSNIFIAYSDLLAAMLLRAAPKKAEKIVSDVLSGKETITRPALLGRMFSKLGTLEKRQGRSFGRKLRVNDNCIGCSWCADNCPRGNIYMKDNEPVFESRCVICLCCIYGCPKNAIYPKIGRFMLLKKGYNLSAVEQRTKAIKYFPPVDRIAKGSLMIGVKKYLNDNK